MPASPLNLLFIFSDQQQRYALGCMDNPYVFTPNLDRLAERGVLFTQAYSNCPICTPFRVNLFTGRYTSQTGARGNAVPIPPGERTFAAALNDGGYRTLYVGKWHLGGMGNGPIPRHLLGDFHEFQGYQCYNGFLHEVCFWDEDGHQQQFDRHRTDVTTDLAIAKLKANAERPFALFVSYQAPHYPVEPSAEYVARYDGMSIPPRPNAAEGVEPYTATQSPPSPKPRENDPNYRRYGNNMPEYRRLYNAMVTQIDANVGRLLHTLDELGLAERTLVIFTSDHGDMQGSHGLTNKVVPYEESAGIPLIARFPGGAAGLRTPALVSGIDFMPTFLDLAGLPAEPRAAGTSFAALLRGEPQQLQGPLFAECRDWYLIRLNQWKLVVQGNDHQPVMLYDLATDPHELRNLVNHPEQATIVADLRDRIVAWHTACLADRAGS